MDALTAVTGTIALYHFQTQEERLVQQTVELNNVGFNGVDAPFASSVAEWILSGKFPSAKQIAALQKIMPKYHGQIEQLNLEAFEAEIKPEIVSYLKTYEKRKPAADSPKEKSAGSVFLAHDDLLGFQPDVYPTTVLKQHGWRKGNYQKWTWVNAFTLPNFNKLMQLFPTALVSAEVLEKIQALQKPAEIPIEIAENGTMFEFQKAATAFLIDPTFSGKLLALKPGLGKTISAIMAADHLGYKKILIVAPLSLLYNWKAEINKWLDEQEICILRKRPSQTPAERWIITNYDFAVRNRDLFTSEKAIDLVIFDESVLLKNRKTARVNAMRDLRKAIPNIWMLSGNPATRFYDDMWAQMNLLNQKAFTSYWRWAGNYCILDQNEWGVSVVGNKPDAAQRIQQDLGKMYFCLSAEDEIKLPDWIFDSVEIPMSKEQYKAYSDIEEIFMASLEEFQEGAGQLVVTNVLAQITRLVQLASNPALLVSEDGGINTSPKWDAALDMLEFEQLPAIIWTNFVATANIISTYAANRHLKVAVLTGETKDIQRQQIVDAFQAGKLDLIVAHPGVGKYGLTLTAARTVIYLERSFNGDDYYQSLYRVRRIGTTVSPHVIHLLSTTPNGAETVDHKIDRVLQYRFQNGINMTTAQLLALWR